MMLGRTLLALSCALALGACGQDDAQPGKGALSPDGGTGGAGGAACDVSRAAGLAVAETDLDAFPPYAIDGCRLLYVSAATGELILKDLAQDVDTVMAAAASAPRRPTLSGDVLGWEADEAGKSVVVVSVAGAVETLAGPFDHAGEPRAAANAVVFTAWQSSDPNGDTDVFLFDVATKTVTPIASGPHQQRFPDVSTTHVAYTDFSEDPAGHYAGDGSSLADVVLVDRLTEQPTPIPHPGKQAFPMLGGTGVLGFLEWVMVHPIPKLQMYTLKSVPLADPSTEPTTIAAVESDARVRPSAQGTLFEWVVRKDEVTTLHRAGVDGSTKPTAVPLSAADLHAPVATNAATVLAVRPSLGSPPELETVPR